MAEPITKWTGARARRAGRHFDRAQRRRQDAALFDLLLRDLDGAATVLDAGAGTGYLTLALAPALTTGRVIALELSADMLRQLEQRAAAAGLQQRVVARQAPASASGLADGSVDLIISHSLLHELQDVDATLREFARVLRPGGRMVVVDFRDTWIGRLMMLWHPRGAHGPFSADGLARALEAAGLREVTVRIQGERLLALARR
ncbi:MAG: class I SAM-dependent methyltransferase [Deltaproteobacteria bacterium]|nr:class I SAM-dependent methyltransferase [Deltaproteobacteria bacterium]